MKNLLYFALLLLLHPDDDTIITRFTVPAGYIRQSSEPGSFGSYLQNLPLKPAGAHTYTYTGAIANTDPYTAAVVDISVGHEDLQQCADAVMRLRGEYLYRQKRYTEIAFHFVSGFNCDYIHYADGYRYHNDKWVLKARKDYSYPTFMNYMQLVFAYAGTLSLDKELKKVSSADDLKAGDIFIHGGSPGHCFVVMDVAENATHQKVFLLAQSFMPAQDIQVLKYTSPWFSLDKPAGIPYGELINPKYLKRFK
ncbi:hypothetical protein BEL04_10380 [Mucilaginibacter sp. PPCGB 2223]|uniref:DUF4846 domain-containing protein n=1 Tax=Mucilaginibacter sp. PPCGB 2223 TaxID=1886027 RepID=UPI000825B264|nr:DUF4846 domain-containing protein [Mucilaginibacter sp. PPCGB 2223]OCX54627.1 hypothetical protein BEL04_10380 [Mucilaginibacter sp. PPCGB 2223]